MKTHYIRLMSHKEFFAYISGEKLENKTNHAATGAHTGSVGFCFFKAKDYKPLEKVHKRLGGIVSPQVAAVFEIDSRIMRKSEGRYADDTSSNFFDYIYVDEYSIEEYSQENAKLVKFAYNESKTEIFTELDYDYYSVKQDKWNWKRADIPQINHYIQNYNLDLLTKNTENLDFGKDNLIYFHDNKYLPAAYIKILSIYDNAYAISKATHNIDEATSTNYVEKLASKKEMVRYFSQYGTRVFEAINAEDYIKDDHRAGLLDFENNLFKGYTDLTIYENSLFLADKIRVFAYRMGWRVDVIKELMQEGHIATTMDGTEFRTSPDIYAYKIEIIFSENNGFGVTAEIKGYNEFVELLNKNMKEGQNDKK